MPREYVPPPDLGLDTGIPWYLSGGGGMRADLDIHPSADLDWYRSEITAEEWAILRADLTVDGGPGKGRIQRPRRAVAGPVWREGARLLVAASGCLYSLHGAWFDLLLMEGANLTIQPADDTAPAIIAISVRADRVDAIAGPPWRWAVAGFASLRQIPTATRSEAFG